MKQQLEAMARRVGVVPDAHFWAMDAVLFAVMYAAARSRLS